MEAECLNFRPFLNILTWRPSPSPLAMGPLGCSLPVLPSCTTPPPQASFPDTERETGRWARQEQATGSVVPNPPGHARHRSGPPQVPQVRG